MAVRNRIKLFTIVRCGLVPCVPALLVLALTVSVSAAGRAARDFATADEAVNALVSALKANDTKALEAIFGPRTGDIVASGDPVADANARAAFATMYKEKHRLEYEGDNKAVLCIGNNDWPFAIPIVKVGSAWRFDSDAGREELLARRIGRNELSVVQVCLVYVDAQREYAAKDRDGDGRQEYAQNLASEPGKHDGLYWATEEGDEPSPMGSLVAAAQSKGYTLGAGGGKPEPFFGYYYRILKAQGSYASGGAAEYVVNGDMVDGFALVAYPAEYGVSGIMTFIVNHKGEVYEKDLGAQTKRLARAMKAFSPDETWKRADGSSSVAE